MHSLCMKAVIFCTYRKIKDSTASNGAFGSRGIRQTSMQAWLFSSLLAEINRIVTGLSCQPFYSRVHTILLLFQLLLYVFAYLYKNIVFSSFFPPAHPFILFACDRYTKSRQPCCYLSRTYLSFFITFSWSALFPML